MKLKIDQTVRIANLANTHHMVYPAQTLLTRNEQHLALLKDYTVDFVHDGKHSMTVRYTRKDYTPV